MSGWEEFPLYIDGARQEVVMKAADCIMAEPCVVQPEDTVRAAAMKMAESGVSVVLVGEKDHFVGMVTDRDITLRAVAAGLGPECLVKDVMSPELQYCYSDEEAGEVARNMDETQMPHLPVVDRQKRVVGIISRGALARSADNALIRRAMDAIDKSIDA